MTIDYRQTADGLEPGRLSGFFVGWPNPPSNDTFLRLLKSSYAVEVAVDRQSGRVVGFVSAISDGLLCAYIPLLEVLPEYQGKGIGQELTRRIVRRLEGLYMVDVVCDPHLEGFYKRAGFSPLFAMIRRDYGAQRGRQTPE